MVKVLIIRRYCDELAVMLQPYLKTLYTKVYSYKGFISAESLVNCQDPNEHLIISFWNSWEDWTRYNQSDEINALRCMIDQAIGQQTSRKVYIQETHHG